MQVPKNCDGKAGLEWLTLPYILESNARRNPEKEAVVDTTYGKRFTYEQAYRRANKVANALTKLGIKDGDRVAYLSLSTEESFHLVFGIASISAVWVPLNFRLLLDVWVSQVNHSGAIALVCQDKYCKAIDPGRAAMKNVKYYIAYGKNIPDGWLDFEQLVGEASDNPPAHEAKYDDLASISYTSGTTGDPKGCMRAQTDWIAYAMLNAVQQRWDTHTKAWTLMDMIHQGGLYVTFSTMFVDGTIYLLELFDPAKAWDMIYKEKLNDIVPIYVGMQMWVNMPNRPDYDMSHVRSVWWGIQTDYNLWQAGLKLFPKAEHNTSFQSTEGYFAMCFYDEFLQQDPAKWEGLGIGKLLEGRAAYGQELMITDIDGNKEVPKGQYGMIWSRGMANYDGYWDAPELNKKFIKPGGWITSEDAGYIDPKTDFLYFVDRVKDIVRSGGENVATSDVEKVLMEHPKIQKVAVIGTPHKQLGETVTAIIELKPGEKATPEEITEFCRGKLGGPALPRRVEFVEKIPVVGFKELIDKKLLKVKYSEKYKI